MRIGAMLGDISRSLFKRPVTERYPFERKPAPERLRGQITFDPAKCTGCKICVRDCPADAIEIVVVDKVAKRFVMRFETGRCTYCAQCVVSCNFDAVGMSHEQWELAALSLGPFALSLGRDEDVRAMREQAAAKPAAAPPAAPIAPPAPATT
jgi:formate hydrogenlyase subunit 6/NADH:ubiquinone oxidoreductase subunit I